MLTCLCSKGSPKPLHSHILFILRLKLLFFYIQPSVIVFLNTTHRWIFIVAGFRYESHVFLSEYPPSLSRCFQVTENRARSDRLSITLHKTIKGQGQSESASLLHFKGSFMENKNESVSPAVNGIYNSVHLDPY